MAGTNTIWAKHALTADGWQRHVAVSIDHQGKICRVQSGQENSGEEVGLLLPAMPNCHSHAFQRAMAGMTETRGDDPQDSFWTWRQLMYRFLEHLTPDDAEAIAAFGQMEMLESGYTSVGEFHYVHHQPNGMPYDNLAEMAERMVAAAVCSGIGLTLLPVMYEQGGCDGRPLAGGQLRFGSTLDEFIELHNSAAVTIEKYGRHANIGIAPHSLRAVSEDSLHQLTEYSAGQPIHIHVAEQQAEVDELLNAYGARPVEWLLDKLPVDNTWCLVHATHMTDQETDELAALQAVAGLCPITESNLGDGVFNGSRFKQDNGVVAIGTDSNIRISLSEELRTLEYSQRLIHKARAVYAEPDRSTARVLYDSALAGGAQSLQRQTGKIAEGYDADMLSLNEKTVQLMPVCEDGWLDAWVFAADDRLVENVWAAGVKRVEQGRHIDREAIEQRYKGALQRLCFQCRIR